MYIMHVIFLRARYTRTITNLSWNSQILIQRRVVSRLVLWLCRYYFIIKYGFYYFILRSTNNKDLPAILHFPMKIIDILKDDIVF